MKTIRIPEEAQRWLIEGERGISSEAIFSHLSGLQIVQRYDLGCDHPRDPSDLARCRKLLERVCEFYVRFEEMATRSPVWKILVDRWDELCDTMDSESPEWREGRGKCPRTFDLMKEIGC